MRILKTSLVAAALCASIAMPTFAGDEIVAPSSTNMGRRLNFSLVAPGPPCVRC